MPVRIGTFNWNLFVRVQSLRDTVLQIFQPAGKLHVLIGEGESQMAELLDHPRKITGLSVSVPWVRYSGVGWRGESLYRAEKDFLFPSIRLKGTKPLSPDSLLKRSIRPALVRAGIVGKQIGWHNFRHSLATNLRAMGVDIKVAQEHLRHANSRTTLDIYTRAVSQQKRDANTKLVEMLLPRGMKMLQHPSAPSEVLEAAGWWR
jgi:hypothetical protein